MPHIYIYIYAKNTVDAHAPCQEGSIGIQHVFSVEVNDEKRDLILQQCDGVLHVFSDVVCMSEKHAYCYKCALTVEK